MLCVIAVVSIGPKADGPQSSIHAHNHRHNISISLMNENQTFRSSSNLTFVIRALLRLSTPECVRKSSHTLFDQMRLFCKLPQLTHPHQPLNKERASLVSVSHMPATLWIPFELCLPNVAHLEPMSFFCSAMTLVTTPPRQAPHVFLLMGTIEHVCLLPRCRMF